ncbi:glycosyl hydrolase 53 family protein [Aureibaculum sp. 2210JD6-5]|uniref:glycoside hydrolase family 53 protein n=1 Tax=Aureibaculum sp. 2210JD6-5 TaxID=3103957 RepID=UPI002AAE370D|nr:glycosyl hydrolase 53 family protein [Aureibaculum sp. 2210JD6-5]MDY7396573.1 glycosyl hydrolase 53 family protein [Aureibaculum sp. 2210JD6-5]
MKHIIIISFLFFLSCSNNSPKEIIEPSAKEYISAVDLSSLPEIEKKNIAFYNKEGKAEDMVSILKKNGVNTVRLRIWNRPETENSGFNEVKSFSKQLQNLGLKVWLTVHYSDTWADPGKQDPPKDWQQIPFTALKDSVYNYTKKIMSEIKPDIIQIGNEINPGLLLPYGDINSNKNQFLEILSTGVKAVRDDNENTKIMIHFAGINNADWFFDQVNTIDYDYIGLSYYPIWHGKDLTVLKNKLSLLSEKHQKEILIAETAYPFTLDWNDWTNNIVGLEEQILPQYPATQQGQKDFITKIKELITLTEKGKGFCYWGGELVAFNGKDATDGSPWENQAVFDFDNKVLPVISAFQFKNE